MAGLAGMADVAGIARVSGLADVTSAVDVQAPVSRESVSARGPRPHAASSGAGLAASAYAARTAIARLGVCALLCLAAAMLAGGCAPADTSADPQGASAASSGMQDASASASGSASADASDASAPASDSGSAPASAEPEFHDADLGVGWQPEGSLHLSYAEGYTVDYFADGFKLICISDGARYLVVPEGKSAPEGLDADVAVIEQPVQDAYLVASDTLCLIDALGLNDRIALSGTKAEDCAVDGFRAALESGDILYGGKYSAPDYELLLETGSRLAIESTMINHVPEVREQLQELGLVVLTEQSSYESTALGRMEWIKLYGALFNCEDRANELFDQQISQVEKAVSEKPADGGGKTVAFFYINANGSAVARQSGDYIPQMIGMAGGSYIFDDLSDGTAKSTITIEMERFYAEAKDADVIVYNTSIDRSVFSVDDLVAKNPLLAEFKAVRSGDVWVTDEDMYQQMIRTGDIIGEFHEVLANDRATDMTYLKRLDSQA